MKCSRCGQTVSAELKAERTRLMGLRTMAGLMRRKARGLPIGRPKVRDDAKIWELRKKGLSIRAIAKLVGVSVAPVQQSLAARRDNHGK